MLEEINRAWKLLFCNHQSNSLSENHQSMLKLVGTNLMRTEILRNIKVSPHKLLIAKGKNNFIIKKPSRPMLTKQSVNINDGTN